MLALGAFLVVAATAEPPARVYTLSARIVSIDVAHGTMTIHHDPFPGMTMAMTMPVHVTPAGLRGLKPGTRITARCDIAIDPWECTDVQRKRR